MYLERNK